MNSSSKVKALIMNHCCSIRASFFHSTPVMERNRRSFWDSPKKQHINYSKRLRKMHSKKDTLKNINACADFLFQKSIDGKVIVNLEVSSFYESYCKNLGERSWSNDYSNADDPYSSKGPSWFRKDYSKNPRSNRTSNKGPKFGGKKNFDFCDNDGGEDVDIETFFRSAFGGSGCFFWSFVNEDSSQFGRSSNRNFKHGNSWRHRFKYNEDDDDSSTDSDLSHSNMASNRMALGLSAYGPLKLEQVKSAYRDCALKWHPDRHQGSSKVVAEEKFKLCSAAYQSLCSVYSNFYDKVELEFRVETDSGPDLQVSFCDDCYELDNCMHLREISIGFADKKEQSLASNFLSQTAGSESNSDGSSFSSSTTMQSSGNVRDVSFCQWCGGPTKHCIPDGEEKLRAICTSCGKITYQNPKMVVGCLIEHDKKVLLCKRNIQPSFGLWTLPAGYMEIGESAAQGATRETWEEAQAEVEVLAPFAQLDIPLIGQTYIIFFAKLRKPHFSPGPESSECRLFAFNEIPFDSLAFSSIFVSLNLYIEDMKAGSRKFHYGIINKRPGSSPSDIRAYTLDDHMQL
ncbi:hypothetical protein ACFE04_031349 [Oxalis oulophora]